jgi:hypothetical protein
MTRILRTSVRTLRGMAGNDDWQHFTGHDVPAVEVEVDGEWLPGDLRAWQRRDGRWWSHVVYRTADGLRHGTFLAELVRPDAVDRSYGRDR